VFQSGRPRSLKRPPRPAGEGLEGTGAASDETAPAPSPA
jgi:hypothetical protein